jgi:hypothetical protein
VIVQEPSLHPFSAALGRFLSEAPWSVAALTCARQRRCNQQVAEAVDQAQAQQRSERQLRPGRPARTVVTGYLVLDHSAQVKRYAKTRAGQGWHYSSSQGEQLPGHSRFQAVSARLGRQLPLTPQLYRSELSVDAKRRSSNVKSSWPCQLVHPSSHHLTRTPMAWPTAGS